jgi:hypothetical protein
VVFVWGETPPIFSVGYDPPTDDWDSGFSVLFDDAPEPKELEHPDYELDPRISVACLHCLLDEHPEIGRGLDLARTHGAADLEDGGSWVGRHLPPIEAARNPLGA